jgi:hypothetical protein
MLQFVTRAHAHVSLTYLSPQVALTRLFSSIHFLRLQPLIFTKPSPGNPLLYPPRPYIPPPPSPPPSQHSAPDIPRCIRCFVDSARHNLVLPPYLDLTATEHI